nr:MAG TPA: hypothetical protein [Caudoviricetes sp.]
MRKYQLIKVDLKVDLNDGLMEILVYRRPDLQTQGVLD